MKPKTYIVPVYWGISALVEVEAESIETAVDLVTGMDLDTIEGADYNPDSFDVDWDNIVEKQPGGGRLGG